MYHSSQDSSSMNSVDSSPMNSVDSSPMNSVDSHPKDSEHSRQIHNVPISKVSNGWNQKLLTKKSK